MLVQMDALLDVLTWMKDGGVPECTADLHQLVELRTAHQSR
jgi:hypothetical protein